MWTIKYFKLSNIIDSTPSGLKKNFVFFQTSKAYNKPTIILKMFMYINKTHFILDIILFFELIYV